MIIILINIIYRYYDDDYYYYYYCIRGNDVDLGDAKQEIQKKFISNHNNII